jgi:SAM-dependent methyltransferase
MFREEALQIGVMLTLIKEMTNPVIANIGSSTEYFRKQIQPHIEAYIFKPLVEKKYKVVHIDLKKDEGVDVIADITNMQFGEEFKNSFHVILCTNLLEHVKDIDAVVRNLFDACRNEGYLLITVPYKYKKHLDPIDNMFRPKPAEITALFAAYNAVPISEKIIVINDKRYYSKKKSRLPIWGYREVISYYLGYRHKVSAILLQIHK